MQEYLGRLVPGAVFTRTRYGENLVGGEAAISSDNSLSVVCSAPPKQRQGLDPCQDHTLKRVCSAMKTGRHVL